MNSMVLQHQLRRRAARLLGSEQLREAHEPRVERTLRSLAHIWLSIGLVFWLGAQAWRAPWPFSVVATVLLGLFMATRVNALNVLVHEGSHGSLAKRRWLNTLLCNVAAGYWILLDEGAYRAVHKRHHQRLNAEDDPDRPLYMLPAQRSALLRGVLADLSGWSVLMRARVYVSNGKGVGSRPTQARLLHMAGKALANLLLLALCASLLGLARGLALYAALWLVPLLCLFPLIIRMRVTAEHFAPELAQPHPPPVFVSRTTETGWLERYLLGAQMELHFEHHLFPGVPHCQLGRLHRLLDERGFFDSGAPVVREHVLSDGYLRFWWHLWRGPHFERKVSLA